ncbi:MAG: hypothetical protein FWE30_08195 [Bacteroidales bacterium]|nr:hypothetical protein [Bacteroidales bacterium]
MEQPEDTFQYLLLNDYEAGFGLRMGRMVYECDLYKMALDLAVEKQKLPFAATVRARIAFRAAYALEYAFFMNQERFVTTYIDRFIESFPKAKNPSAQRHFGKIMATLLRAKPLFLTPEQADAVAEAAASWLVHPKSKVAVQIWALEILTALAPRVEWVAEMLPDAIGLLSLNPTPAMKVRLRR